MSITELGYKIKKHAYSLGFNMVGVVAAQPGKRLGAYKAWLTKQYHGEMSWMGRPDRVARREDLTVILPEVQSIVVVGLEYWPGQLPEAIANDPSRGRISNYSWGVDYHLLMEPRLQELANWLSSKAGVSVQSKIYVDTGAILERDHGESAGLGFTGKNTMLINPTGGSWFFLGELLTTAKLKPNVLDISMPSCGTCTRCLADCPTGAFPLPYVLDARRCISYLTIELKGWIPRELRPLMRNWIYGCDVCQEVCPFNRFAKYSQEQSFFAEEWDKAAPMLVDMLGLDEFGFLEKFKGSPVERIGRDRLVRNSCVAAGNWGSRVALEYLITLLSDSAPIVRGHAAWAVGKIGGDVARKALERVSTKEELPAVREEIQFALHECAR